MIELLTLIHLWCSTEKKELQCKHEMLACVLEGKKPGDGKAYLEMKVLECLKKK